jgi:hypothetical protein
MSDPRVTCVNGVERIENSAPQPEALPSCGAPAERASRIRALNDQLRTTGRGGIVQMTIGVASLGFEKVEKVFAALRAFSDFTPDNDPWGEHDCAAFEVDGVRFIWKIDYHDRARTYHSPDPAEPKVTVRVLTVMRADEY